MKNLILFYISVRTILVAFYDVYPLPGFRVTDLVGSAFLVVLFIYYFENRHPLSRLQKKIFVVTTWAFLSTLIIVFAYELNIYSILKQFFKMLNGLAVFITFPLIFKNMRDVNRLTNAFLISTIFPGLQITAQYLFGADFLGMKAYVASGDITMLTGVYGNYGVFGLISWIGLLSVIIKLGSNIKKNRFLHVSLFIFYLLVGFTTFSRTITVLMFVILLGFISLLARSKKGGILLLIIFLGLIAINLPVVDHAYENIKKRSLGEIEVLMGERDIAYGLHGRIGRWDEHLKEFFSEYNIFEQMVGTDLYIGPHGDYFSWLFSYGIIGLLLYLSFFTSLFLSIKNRLKRERQISHKYYGTAVLLGVIIWMIMAISTNPSLIPDFGYFVLGNGAIFLSITRQRYNNNSLADINNK